MAVLKSPRNTKNKDQWASKYVLKTRAPIKRAEEKRRLRGSHQLEYFIWKYADWTTRDGISDYTLLEPRPDTDEEKVRIRRDIKCGIYRFDSTLVNPPITKRHLREKYCRRKTLIIVSGDLLVASS